MPSPTAHLLHSPAALSGGYDPFLRGRFPVGVRTFEAQDSRRNRLFPCELWYPAANQHAGQDLEPETQDSFTPQAGSAQRKQAAVRDAVPFPETYSLIVFSHHSLGNRRAATYLCTHLSSHGYMVAALDHSEVVAPELGRQQDETEEQRRTRALAVIASRVPDVQFILDRLLDPTNWNAEARPDSKRIGIVGHSLGGWTTLATPEVDQRIGAIVALAPGGSSNPRPGILPGKLTFQWARDVPTLYLVAENDVPLPLAGMYELFARTPSPKQMVILRRADHLHFIDNVEEQHEAFRTMEMPGLPAEVAGMQKEMRPISELTSGQQAQLWVRGLTLAHFDAVLRDRPEAKKFLAGDIEAALARRGVDVVLYKP